MKPDVRPDDARFLELLDRWMQGNFTRTDERELHALTDSDEFRREAWEGLTALPEEDHATRLTALRRRLQGQPGGRTVLFPQWMAAAAALVVLLAAVWFFNPWKQKQDDTMAGVSPKTNTVSPELPADEPPIAGNSSQIQPSQTPAASRPAGESRSGPRADSIVQPPIASAEYAIQTESKQDLALEDEAAPPASRADKATAAKPLPTTPAPVVSAPPGAPMAARDEAAKKAKTAPARDADSTRKFNVDDRPDMNAVKQLDPEKVQPAPDKGWDDFYEYLRQNARLTPEARNNNITGSVLLQFSVNSNGEVYNILVVKGLGYGCDQEAIRLIKGWDWTAGQIPLTVEVKFVR